MRYLVEKQGTRWCTLVIRPGTYGHPEERRAVIARRRTKAQAASVVRDCEARDKYVQWVIQGSAR